MAFNSGIKSTDIGFKRQPIGESFEEGLKDTREVRAPRKPRALRKPRKPRKPKERIHLD